MPKITFFFYSSQPRFKTVSTVTMGLKHFSFQRLSLAFPKDKTGDKFARHNLLLFSLVWNVSRSDTSLHTSSPFWSETKLNVRQDDDDDDGIDAHAVVVDVMVVVVCADDCWLASCTQWPWRRQQRWEFATIGRASLSLFTHSFSYLYSRSLNVYRTHTYTPSPSYPYILFNTRTLLCATDSLKPTLTLSRR